VIPTITAGIPSKIKSQRQPLTDRQGTPKSQPAKGELIRAASCHFTFFTPGRPAKECDLPGARI